MATDSVGAALGDAVVVVGAGEPAGRHPDKTANEQATKSMLTVDRIMPGLQSRATCSDDGMDG